MPGRYINPLICTQLTSMYWQATRAWSWTETSGARRLHRPSTLQRVTYATVPPEQATATHSILKLVTLMLTCQLGERSTGNMWWWIISAEVSRLTPICSSRRQICGIATMSLSNCGWTVSMSDSNTAKLSAHTAVISMFIKWWRDWTDRHKVLQNSLG